MAKVIGRVIQIKNISLKQKIDKTIFIYPKVDTDTENKKCLIEHFKKLVLILIGRCILKKSKIYWPYVTLTLKKLFFNEK